MTARTLNERQAAFVREYLVDLNGTQAAIRAGYSPQTADVQASQLLGNLNVSEAVREALEARAKAVGVTAERVVRELAHMAFYDPATIAQAPMSGPQDIANLPEEVRRAVIGWSWDRKGKFVLKLAPKTPSLELLGRHLGMFTDKMRLTGAEGGPVEITYRWAETPPGA